MEARRRVSHEVRNIPGLSQGLDDNDESTRNLRRNGIEQIAQIFGHADLVGNFTMTNAITYTQFCRIDELIQKKDR